MATRTLSSFSLRQLWPTAWGASGTLVVALRHSVVSEDGVEYPATANAGGALRNLGPHWESTITVNSNLAECGAVSGLFNTDTAIPSHVATYDIYVYDSHGKMREKLNSKPFHLHESLNSNSSTFTWEQWVNAMEFVQFRGSETFIGNQATVQAMIDTIAYQKANVLQNGLITTSVPPISAPIPIAVENSDPRTIDISSYASFAAMLAAVGSTPTTFNITSSISIPANATVPSTLTLRFLQGGSVSVANGMTLTIRGPVIADPVKIFYNALSGQGSILFTSNKLTEIHPEWWGAVCDDATDDSGAINAAIASLGSTAATRGGPRIVIRGPSAISSTVLINRKAITFGGAGWGRQGQTGPQAYLRWIGAAGSPMLRIQNAQGLTVRDLRLIGKSSAKPSCAISFFQEAGFGMNMNRLQNIAIGDIADSTTIGTGFTSGILWEGTLGNNAEWQMVDIAIQGCSSYGIRQSSVQNVNVRIDGLQVAGCGVGLYPTGAIDGSNWNFSGNTLDFEYPVQDDTPQNVFARVNVDSFYSELSARLADLGGSGVLALNGGQFQVGSFTAADGKIVRNDNEGNITVRLTDFSFPQVSSPTTAPFFEMLSPSGEHSLKTIILDGIENWISGGPDGTGLSVASSGTLDQRYIYFRTSAIDESGGGGNPPNESRCWIYGDFSGGETFQFNRFDIPTRLRLIPQRFGQEIDAAGDTILNDYANKVIFNDSGGSITLTSTPTIPSGVNGEVMKLINIGPDNVVIQDQGTLPGSNLRLTAATVTLGPRDSIELTYLTLVGDWVQTGPLVNVL